MAAQEAAACRRQRRRPSASTIACLVLPASVISVPSGTVLGGRADVLDDPADRRADHDQVGLGHALGQIDRRVGHRPDPPGNPQAGLAAADADDRRGAAAAQRQPDRSADQPHADDGHRRKPLHRSIPGETGPSKAAIVAGPAATLQGTRLGGQGWDWKLGDWAGGRGSGICHIRMNQRGQAHILGYMAKPDATYL